MADDILTTLHGRLLGLGNNGELVIPSGIIMSDDGTPMSFPDGIIDNVLAQRSVSGNYTLTADDEQSHIYHPVSDTTPRTWTIPANSSVPYSIGTVITFVNDIGAGALTIAITTDTMWLAGSASTGSRTLASGGVATALKVTATRWVISGAGLT